MWATPFGTFDRVAAHERDQSVGDLWRVCDSQVVICSADHYVISLEQPAEYEVTNLGKPWPAEATVLLDPLASKRSPSSCRRCLLIPPDGYVVQAGDHESGLGLHFFDGPRRLRRIQRHPPVVARPCAVRRSRSGWVVAAGAADRLAPIPDPRTNLENFDFEVEVQEVPSGEVV